MIGTLLWNVILAALGFILTFAFSTAHNLVGTSLVKGLISGVLFFLLGFIIRYGFGSLVGMKENSPNVPANSQKKNQDSGRTLDLSTPDDSLEVQELLKQQNASGNDAASESGSGEFTPLAPPKLATKQSLDPEHLAKAVRHISEE